MEDSSGKKTPKGKKLAKTLGEWVSTQTIPTKSDQNTPIADHIAAKKGHKATPSHPYKPNTPLRPSKSSEALNSPGIPARRRAQSSAAKPNEEKGRDMSGK